MNNAMLAKEWRKAPLTRTTDFRAARPRPAHLVKPFELKGTASWSSSIEHTLVVVADCVTTVANSAILRAPALLKRVPRVGHWVPGLGRQTLS